MHWLMFMIFHLAFLCCHLLTCFTMTTHTKYYSFRGSCVGTVLQQQQQQFLPYQLDCSVLCVTEPREDCTAYSLQQTTSAEIGYHCTLLSNVTGLRMRDDSHCFGKCKISLSLAGRCTVSIYVLL